MAEFRIDLNVRYVEELVLRFSHRLSFASAVDIPCRKSYDPKTHIHIPYSDNKDLTGTIRRTSIQIRLSGKRARHDGLESFSSSPCTSGTGNSLDKD